MISSPSLMVSRLSSPSTRVDPDIESKARSSIRAVNEAVQSNANEPSLAFYRIQEHVAKSLPSMIQKRMELENLHERMNGLIFDVEYSFAAVGSLRSSEEHVNNITAQLENAIKISKQINLVKQQQLQQQLFEKKYGSQT